MSPQIKKARENIAAVYQGTMSMNFGFRRVLSVVGVIVGALLLVKGLDKDTTWADMPELLGPLVVLGLIFQIVSALLSSNGKS